MPCVFHSYVSSLTSIKVNGKKVVTPKPETEEYNVQSFIYSQRRPFHPLRLFALVHDKFILQMEHEESDDEADDEMDVEDDDSDIVIVDAEDRDNDSDGSENADSATTVQSSPPPSKLEQPSTAESEQDLVTPSNQVILENKRSHPVFARLFRSKGEFFLATRPHRAGEWSQAGAMLTLTGGRPWFCTLPPEEYTTGENNIDSLVQHDIAKGGEWGDRRQELVFIGEKLERQKLAALLDACILTDSEFEDWERVMRNQDLDDMSKREALEELFDDGFPEWPGDNEDEDHDHEGHSHSHPLVNKPKQRLWDDTN